MKKVGCLEPKWKAIIARTRAARATLEEGRIEHAHTWEPRAYQQRAVAALLERFSTSKRVLGVGPPGCGKTAIASMVLQAYNDLRAIFVVHRYELADQAFGALQSSGIEVGIMMGQEEALNGKRRVNPRARVQVASIQTLSRRRAPFKADLLIFDEAHRVLAESYQTIVAAQPQARILGLTATAERGDGRGLGEFFDDLYEIAQPSELHAGSFLAEPRWFGAPPGYRAKLKERLRGVRSVGGDFAPTGLARALDSRYLVGRVVDETLRLAAGRSKVVFAGSVAHSNQLAAAFRARDVVAVHLGGDTAPDLREQMLIDLRSGKIEMICNYDVLSEGWDLPSLGCVVLARPFLSFTRYLQCVGRGMRWREGDRPLVLDFGDNAPRFGVWPGDDVGWTLNGRERGVAPWKQCEGCQARIPVATARCPECGFECPKERDRRRACEEADAKLEEATRMEYLNRRRRIEVVAEKYGAPSGWVDKIIQGASGA